MRKIIASIGIGLLFLSMLSILTPQVKASGLTLDPWSMFRPDSEHMGFSDSVAPNTNNILWAFQIGGRIISSPAVADGMVFVGAMDDNRTYALDQSSGTLLWSSQLDERIWGSPAVSGDKVFITDWSNLYALSESTGAIIWRQSIGSLRAEFSSPTVADGMVFIGSDGGGIMAFSQDTGSLVWSYFQGLRICSTPAVADGLVFATSFGGNNKVYALKESSGELVWSKDVVYDGSFFSSPAVSDGKVFVGLQSVDTQNGAVLALNEYDGTIVWSQQIGAVFSSPAVAYGRVFIGCYDHKLYAFDETNGNLIWSYSTGDSIQMSSPAVADDKVFVGSDDHNLYAIDAITGTAVWSYTTGGWVESSPAVADGVVYVGSNDGKLYAVGASRYSVFFEGSGVGNPAQVWSVALDGYGTEYSNGPGNTIYTIVFTGVANGGPYQFTVTPPSGFVAQPTSGPATVSGGDVHQPITFSPVPVTYTFTLAAGSGGSVTYLFSLGSGTVLSGQSQQLIVPQNCQIIPTANPDSLHVFQTWSTTGSLSLSDPSSASATVTVNGNSGVAAIFAMNTFSVSVSPTTVTMDVDQSQLFTSNVASGTAPYTYQWYLNNAAVFGATNPTWTFTPASAASYAVYSVYVKVTDAASAVATSNTVQVNVYLQPTVTISPAPATIDVGESQLFTSTTLDGAWPFTFQWYLNDNPVQGATDGLWTFTPTGVGSYTIQLQVKDSVGADATSNTANVNVMVSVTFTESGLPLGVGWSVSFNSASFPFNTKSSSSNSIAFSVPNGNYYYSVAPPVGYTIPSSQAIGTVTVGGQNINMPTVTFSLSPAEIKTEWDTVKDSYDVKNPSSPWGTGTSHSNCLGISSTALMYFMRDRLEDTSYPFFPSQSPTATSTSDLNLNVKTDLLTGKTSFDTLNDASLAVTFNQMYLKKHFAPQSFPLPEWEKWENQQFIDLLANLTSGHPVVLSIGQVPPLVPSTEQGWGHAVVAVGAKPETSLGVPTGIVGIYIYDPNYPKATKTATYDTSAGIFSYSDPTGSSYNVFYVANPPDMLPPTVGNPLQTLFPNQEWWRNWLTESVQGYTIVVARVKVTIEATISGNTFEDYFNGDGLGDSQSFICGITGSSGIVEGGLQIYAIPDSAGAFSVGEVTSSGVSASSIGTVTSAGGVSVDQTSLTGVSVYVTGSSVADGTPVTITTQKLIGQPTFTGIVEVGTTPAAYYDVYVEGISDGIATVWITNIGVVDQTGMQYWNGAQWVMATNVVVTSGNAICGNIPVSALTGTPIAIGPIDNTPPTTGIVFGQPSIKVAERVFLTGSTPVSFTAADNQGGSGVSLTTYKVYNNTIDSDWLTYNGACNLSSYTDGNYTIAYNSTDNAGNIEKTNTVQVTLFYWNYVFKDSDGRGTVLKVNAVYKFFQFTAPTKDFGVKYDSRMVQLCKQVIIICYEDRDMRLGATAVKDRTCLAIAYDKQACKNYCLIMHPPVPKYTLTICCKDSTGQAVLGASVYVNGNLQGVTDSGGKLTVPNLTAGTYAIAVKKNGYKNTSVNVTMSSDKTITITMK